MKKENLNTPQNPPLSQDAVVIKSACDCGSTKFNTTVKDKPFCFLCGKDARETVKTLKINKMSNEEMNGNIAKPILPADWCGLEDTPPDELVEVIDSKGNKALAYPTWYPFKVVPNSNKIGKWTSDIVTCKPYWDGGWLIECVGLSNSIETVVGWKPICA